jgi:hypothetical protein
MHRQISATDFATQIFGAVPIPVSVQVMVWVVSGPRSVLAASRAVLIGVGVGIAIGIDLGRAARGRGQDFGEKAES